MSTVSFVSTDNLSIAAAQRIAAFVKGSGGNARFGLVLSGGSTPRPIYELLAKDSSIDWHRVHLFWGDERFVPHDDPQSNYRMAKESLMDHISIPQENIHPIPTHLASPEAVAEAYASEIERYRPFDLILLGLGEDGHTASLFPGAEFNPKENMAVIVTHSPKPPIDRISISLSIINEASRVFFLVSGKEKSGILKTVLADSENSEPKYPAACVKPRGELVWFVDQDASPGD